MTAATAVEIVDPATGEVVSTVVAPFDMEHYLDGVKAMRHLTQQRGLMAAYDRAVTEMIGPNDVQEDHGRTFKKKSAWRKLARYFGISVFCSLDSVRVERHGAGFTAYAAASATAPWGQSWTDVGACGSDEAVGRRVITEADAVATAMTRASNRAVSNLVAMGEVSAEEIGERQSASAPKAARDKLMPFGKRKGTRLGDLSGDDLMSARNWCREKDAAKFATLIGALEEVIAEKSDDALSPALQDEADDLPF